MLTEPEPIWPEAGRLRPAILFPPYRHVPGLTPHPIKDPKGHSYGKDHENFILCPPQQWREDEAYLFGIDLYHFSYFWESHEAWEAIWQQSEKSGVQGQFIQALIQNSAAQMKVHAAEPVGTRRLCRAVVKRLDFVEENAKIDANGRYMGIDLAGLIEQTQRHYGPMLTCDEGPLQLVGRPPRLCAE